MLVHLEFFTFSLGLYWQSGCSSLWNVWLLYPPLIRLLLCQTNYFRGFCCLWSGLLLNFYIKVIQAAYTWPFTLTSHSGCMILITLLYCSHGSFMTLILGVIGCHVELYYMTWPEQLIITWTQTLEMLHLGLFQQQGQCCHGNTNVMKRLHVAHIVCFLSLQEQVKTWKTPWQLSSSE